MIVPEGSIIEFGAGEDNTIWFAAAAGRQVYLEPERPGSDIIFAYKKFVK